MLNYEWLGKKLSHNNVELWMTRTESQLQQCWWTGNDWEGKCCNEWTAMIKCHMLTAGHSAVTGIYTFICSQQFHLYKRKHYWKNCRHIKVYRLFYDWYIHQFRQYNELHFTVEYSTAQKTASLYTALSQNALQLTDIPTILQAEPAHTIKLTTDL
jgi:hypothetical protein